jgi:Glycosyl hydrolase family 63 C-terminal domain
MMAMPFSASSRQRLHDTAVEVLRQNDLGHHTKPAPRLYPYQWLWDSCFIAIGLRHLHLDRARQEVLSLFRGQWRNGMLPSVIFSDQSPDHPGPDLWRSDVVPDSSPGVLTSCITQPPLVAEATVRVGELLPTRERRDFYRAIFPGLVRFHEWLYRDRDPERTGLVALVHAWESGIEDSPPWAQVMRTAAPTWIKAFRPLMRAGLFDRWRPDRVHGSVAERPTTDNYFTLYHLQRRIRAQCYQLARILRTPGIPVVQDVLYNALLIRANQHLRSISEQIGADLPAGLPERMEETQAALEGLYADGGYWSRDHRTGQLLQVLGIGNLTALYAGTIPRIRADELAASVTSREFWPRYGVASAPTNSPYFRPRGFWQGPVWVTLNWLIADGLDRCGHSPTAERLRAQTLELVGRAGGMHENYSALDGRAGGTPAFSCTAALVLDMLAGSGSPAR